MVLDTRVCQTEFQVAKHINQHIKDAINTPIFWRIKLRHKNTKHVSYDCEIHE
jgi:hypothetical protein